MKLQSFYQKELMEAGCDEAGRGCYAGPVFAAAVILPEDFEHPLLNDSKKVKEADRTLLRQYIELHAKSWAVVKVEVDEIDRINILKASFLAMHRSISQLQLKPEFLLIDGNRFEKYQRVPHKCIIKGDGKYASIAAASILAKTHRDEWMKNLHASFPQYQWDKNKGYGTADHRAAIEHHGLCVHHRKSFKIGWEQQELF
ncbi:MAG: ribonuclease HII [Bacteroidota bacterium]